MGIRLGKVTFDFTGSTVLVTGGARGIGLEIGRAFRSWCADVVLIDQDRDELDHAAAEIGAFGVVADVRSTDEVEAAVRESVDLTGRLDVLVNNAGILRDNVVWKITDEDWTAVMATHAGGTFRFTRAVIPVMRAAGGGRIVNVTSYAGIRGNTGQANYSMAKAGIIGFTKTTAKELARFGITVNAISPNAVTRMVDSIPTDKRADLAAEIPMERFGMPEEMAPAVAFLASEQAQYITGVVLPVDGGISM
jgi:3-oxoacyl-[acyl-carrier protein] reductase